MPDISMCQNKDCPKRKQCHRFMAMPNGLRPSYMGFKPDDKGECEYFWPLSSILRR